MIPTLHHYYLARLTLEAATPLSIAAGGSDGIFDMVLIRDANGLPTLPGSAIAGVLRHLFWELHTEETMQQIFGCHNHEKKVFSRLQVSWGYIQDSQSQPVEGLLLGQQAQRLYTDPLLQAAVISRELPVHRDRVRINHRGAVDSHGKFDRTILPAGYRFSVELALWSDKADDLEWQQLLQLLNHPLFRLGGGTRSGLGSLKLIRASTGHFDLKTFSGRAAFANLPRSVGATQSLNTFQITHSHQTRFITATINLTPHSFWRIGQGDKPTKFDHRGKAADLLPKLEQRVEWENGKGSFSAAQLLIPASSIKGTLAHRVAFHANCKAGRWAVDNKTVSTYAKENDPEIQNLFGLVRNFGTTNQQTQSQIGRILIDDGFIAFTKKEIETNFKIMMHNVIDRFTGGVRNHMLFMEELIWQKGIAINLIIDTHNITDNARQALQLALADLCQGSLSLGSDAGKGHGFFTGTINWSDKGYWINQATVISSQMKAVAT